MLSVTIKPFPNQARAKQKVFIKRALAKGNKALRVILTPMNITQLEVMYRHFMGAEPPHINTFMNSNA